MTDLIWSREIKKIILFEKETLEVYLGLIFWLKLIPAFTVILVFLDNHEVLHTYIIKN